MAELVVALVGVLAVIRGWDMFRAFTESASSW